MQLDEWFVLRLFTEAKFPETAAGREVIFAFCEGQITLYLSMTFINNYPMTAEYDYG